MDIKITDKLFEQVSPVVQQQLLTQAKTAFDVELNSISDKKKKAEFFDTKQIKFINDYISKELPSKIIKLKKIQAKNAEKSEIARLKQEVDSRMIKLTQEEADKILSTKHWNKVYKNVNAVKAESRKRAQKRFDKEVSKKEAGENIKSALVSNPFIKRVLDHHAKKEKAYNNRQKHKDNKLKTKNETKNNRKKRVSAFKGKVVKKLNKNPFGKLLVKIGGVLTKVLSSWLAKLSIGLMILKFIMSPMGMMVIAFISAWFKHKVYIPFIKPVVDFIVPLITKIGEGISFMKLWSDEIAETILSIPEKISEFGTSVVDFFKELPLTILKFITDKLSDFLISIGTSLQSNKLTKGIGDSLVKVGKTVGETSDNLQTRTERRNGTYVSEAEKLLTAQGPSTELAKIKQFQANQLERSKHIKFDSKEDLANFLESNNRTAEKAFNRIIEEQKSQKILLEQQQTQQLIQSTVNNVSANAYSINDDARPEYPIIATVPMGDH